MEKNGPYIVLDPTQGCSGSDEKGQMAARVSTLNGKVLGVVNNGKRNSDVFLKSMIHLLRQQYQLKDVVWIDKTNVSLPLTDAMLEKLKASHAVISGIGD